MACSGSVILQNKLFKWPHPIFELDLALYLYTLEFSLRKDDLYAVWLKLACWFWFDWLFLLFYVPLKNISLIWRRHHCRWRAAKFRPMLGAQGLWAGRDRFRATPAVTRGLSFSGLIRRTAPFSRLLRHVWRCRGPILTRILTGSWFWRRRLSKLFSVFLLFCYNLPLGKGIPLHLNKFESPSPKTDLCQLWLKLAQWFFWRSRKCISLQTDKGRSEKLTWAFTQVGELKSTNSIMLIVESGMSQIWPPWEFYEYDHHGWFLWCFRNVKKFDRLYVYASYTSYDVIKVTMF
jgi:hypothetical protein